MTELLAAPEEGSCRFFSWRKLIYFMLAAGAATLIAVWFPAEKTVRIAWRIASDNHAAMRIAVPEKCRISACYLRVGEPLPAGETPLILLCDGETVAPGPLCALARSPVQAEPGTANLLLPLALRGKKDFTLRQKAVDPALERGGCELVLEITGPDKLVSDWSGIVRLEAQGARKEEVSASSGASEAYRPDAAKK